MADNLEIAKSLRKQADLWLSQSSSIVAQFVKREERKYIDYLDNESNRPHTVSTASALISYTINYRLQGGKDLPALKDAMTVFNSSKHDGYWSSDPELKRNVYEGAQILYALELHKKNNVDMERHRQLMKEYVNGYNPNSTVEPSCSYYKYHPFLLYLVLCKLNS